MVTDSSRLAALLLTYPLSLGAPLAVRQPPKGDGHVLGIVYRCIATHLINEAAVSRKTTQTGAVTLVQRFGSALNLNVHSHRLFLDGAPKLQ